MALNWAMIGADQRPVPLPEEKIWLAVEKCQMSLEFKEAKAKWDAKGTVYVTNQRVVFLRIPPLPQPAEQAEASQHLRSLNVPLTHLVDSRYLIPIFGAPYYEASVLPVPGGNLPESRQGGPASKGLCKIWFNEGGGAAFRDAVEEVRNLARGGQHGEQLPLYQPPSAPSGSAAPSIAATANSSLESRTVAGDHSERSSVAGPSYLSGRPSSRASQLSAQDLDAARVAHREEEAEREAIRQRAEAGAAAPGIEATQAIAASQAQQASQVMDEDEPPAYAMVSPVTTYVRAQEGESSRESGRQRRARELRESLSKVMRSDEGRDRILQLCLGLALLAHHSFGSVRHPRSYGIYPIPHVLFLFFSRSVRREALTGMRYTGQAAEKSRKLLLLLRWLRGLLWRARQTAEGYGALDEAKTRRRRGDESLEQERQIDPRQQKHDSDTHGNDTTNIEPEELTSWQQRLAHLGELLASVGEAVDIAAFLGGSTIAWKTVRGGHTDRGKKALRQRQRHMLDRIALSLGIITLLIQAYTLSALRRRSRRALGHLHRRVLLLTDDLADAQEQEEDDAPEQCAPTTLPRLHVTPSSPLLPAQTASDRSSSSVTSISSETPSYSPLAASRDDTRSPRHSSRLGRIRQSMSLCEARFQSVRHSMSVLGWELTTTCCELGSAVLEGAAPGSGDTEGWQAYLAIAAGATGLVKVAKEDG